MILVDGGGCKMANPFHSTGSPIVDRMCRQRGIVQLSEIMENPI